MWGGWIGQGGAEGPGGGLEVRGRRRLSMDPPCSLSSQLRVGGRGLLFHSIMEWNKSESAYAPHNVTRLHTFPVLAPHS